MNLSVKLFVQQFNKQEVNIKLFTILNTTLPGTLSISCHQPNQLKTNHSVINCYSSPALHAIVAFLNETAKPLSECFNNLLHS